MIARWLSLAIGQAYTLVGKEVPVGIKAHSTRAMAKGLELRLSRSAEWQCGPVLPPS